MEEEFVPLSNSPSLSQRFTQLPASRPVEVAGAGAAAARGARAGPYGRAALPLRGNLIASSTNPAVLYPNYIPPERVLSS